MPNQNAKKKNLQLFRNEQNFEKKVIFLLEKCYSFK